MRIRDWSSDVCSSDLPKKAITKPKPAAKAAPKAISKVKPKATAKPKAKAKPKASATPVADLRQPIITPRPVAPAAPPPIPAHIPETRRAQCRESVCQYVSIQVAAVSLKKKQKK